MAYAKNKSSSEIHASRTRFLSSSKTPAQKAIITVIILAMLTVIASLISSFLQSPEHRVKSTIAKLAADYYENYFYPDISTNDISSTLSKYTETGFSRTSLRQLLLYDNQKNAEYRDLITKYCDENSTYVQFFPTEPFGNTNYRIEYTYTCNF